MNGLPLFGTNNQSSDTFSGSVDGGNLYAPFIISNGNLEQLLDNEPNNK